MRDKTRAILQSIESWPLFEHVGEPIGDPGVVAIGSWSEAVDPRRSYIWECLRLQVKNVTTRTVNARDWHWAQGLNPLVEEVKQILKPLFGRIRALGSRLSLPEEAFYHQVAWDLVGHLD